MMEYMPAALLKKKKAESLMVYFGGPIKMSLTQNSCMKMSQTVNYSKNIKKDFSRESSSISLDDYESSEKD